MCPLCLICRKGRKVLGKSMRPCRIRTLPWTYGKPPMQCSLFLWCDVHAMAVIGLAFLLQPKIVSILSNLSAKRSKIKMKSTIEVYASIFFQSILFKGWTQLYITISNSKCVNCNSFHHYIMSISHSWIIYLTNFFNNGTWKMPRAMKLLLSIEICSLLCSRTHIISQFRFGKLLSPKG